VTSKKITVESTNWNEIMEQVEIRSVPLEYVKTIVIKFIDGDQWEFDVSETDYNAKTTEDLLESITEEYDNEIDAIEFKLNMNKVKNDIQKYTKKFLSKKK
jgi:hypothetical protein